MNDYTETKVDKYIIRKYINGYEEWIFDGYSTWRLNGKRHRLEIPAVKGYDGFESWHVNDNTHRIDGPAVKRSNGHKAYYLNNKYYLKEEYKLIPILYRMSSIYE